MSTRAAAKPNSRMIAGTDGCLAPPAGREEATGHASERRLLRCVVLGDGSASEGLDLARRPRVGVGTPVR